VAFFLFCECIFFWARKRRKREDYGKAPFFPPFLELPENKKMAFSALAIQVNPG
jgi:hypothetical protein